MLLRSNAYGYWFAERVFRALFRSQLAIHLAHQGQGFFQLASCLRKRAPWGVDAGNFLDLRDIPLAALFDHRSELMLYWLILADGDAD